MKKLLLLLLSCPLLAQVQGKVTDTSGQPLPFVSVLVENSYNGTTTNDGGQYELAVKQPGHYVIVFQYLGFKTKKVAVDYTGQPFPLDVSLADENIALHEVVIGTDENPANEIIRKAIANRGENAGKTARYTADFYSRGIFRIKNAPKKVLGAKLDMFDDMLDSTRTPIADSSAARPAAAPPPTMRPTSAGKRNRRVRNSTMVSSRRSTYTMLTATRLTPADSAASAISAAGTSAPR